jgi:hypothetical protein
LQGDTKAVEKEIVSTSATTWTATEKVVLGISKGHTGRQKDPVLVHLGSL